MKEVEKNIFNVFPIHIFVERNFLSDKHCDLILRDLAKLDMHPHNLLEGDAASSYKYFSQNELFDEILSSIEPIKDIKERLQQRIDYFTSFSRIQSCSIHHSWCNVQNENSSLTVHAHNGSVVSGALYINTDKNSSDLQFINPNYAIHLGFGLNRENDFLYKQKVERGTLILFPSYLAHGNLYSQNKTKNRVVISFNTQ